MARVELHRAQEALEAEHYRSLSEPTAVRNERRRWLGMQFHQRVLEAADEALRSAAARGDMKELRELLASDGWLASDESRLAGSAQLRQLRLASTTCRCFNAAAAQASGQGGLQPANVDESTATA